ncbi:hypothetical protein BV22DRAFT_1130547 [Leucogyrophana mollusca]|uniref:Uncharacterized protein n=1 Tax=Leucogyrophana mollusca TaxID=85980 RepID=A0ACB8BE25_9AGAM|nr:hypothetical protein BV22DRAFT_1130547 [Leucogyrophana mollusca]
MPARLGSVRRPSPPSLGESTSLGSSCLKQKQMQDFGDSFLGAYDERMGRVCGFELFAASSFPNADLKHPGVSALSTPFRTKVSKLDALRAEHDISLSVFNSSDRPRPKLFPLFPRASTPGACATNRVVRKSTKRAIDKTATVDRRTPSYKNANEDDPRRAITLVWSKSVRSALASPYREADIKSLLVIDTPPPSTPYAFPCNPASLLGRTLAL